MKSKVPTGITAYRDKENGEIAGSYPRPEMQRVQELQEANAILAQQAADWYALYSRAMKERSAEARDAARYRWLRHNSGYWIRCHQFGDVWGHEHKDADLDGLIDEQIRIDFGIQEQKPRGE